MTEKEYKKIRSEYAHFKRGGLPDLGKPHSKAGYRWMTGVAKDQNGKVDRWRENLGSDLLVAQYRARAMSFIWFDHVLEELHVAAYEARLEAIDLNTDVEPLDKREAKSEAWANALEAMNEPARLAEEANIRLRDPHQPARPTGTRSGNQCRHPAGANAGHALG